MGRRNQGRVAKHEIGDLGGERLVRRGRLCHDADRPEVV